MITNGKTQKSLKVIVYEHSQTLRFFANVSPFFQQKKSHNNITGAFLCYFAILLSFMQCDDGFLKTLKNFDYWCSVVLKQPITSKNKDVIYANEH